jgi:hypothetical protein
MAPLLGYLGAQKDLLRHAQAYFSENTANK